MRDSTEDPRGFSDEELMAYADGELSAARRAQLDAHLPSDATLRARLARFTDTRAALRTAFADIADEAVPARLTALFEPPASKSTPPSMDAPRRGRRPDARRRTIFGGLALAASLALAFAVGLHLRPDVLDDSQGAATVVAASALQPDTALLARALEHQPSGVPLATRTAQREEEILPISTLTAADGRYCREFSATYAQDEQARHARGLACREAGPHWRLLALVDANAAAATAGAGYVTAGAGDVLDADRLLPGATTLTPQDEAQLIGRGWK